MQNLTRESKRYLVELASELADDVLEAPTTMEECQTLADGALLARQDTCPLNCATYPESATAYLAECLADVFGT